MVEDWGAEADAPKFTLFKRVTPEEAAATDTYVDSVVYNRWKKAERRLYQRLKTERIARLVHEASLRSVDSITSALESLTLLKADSGTNDATIDELIGKVQELKLKAVEEQSKADR